MSSAPWITDFNSRFLHSVGPDGRYNRDRLFAQIGVRPTASGDYSTVSLTDQQRHQMKALIEQETGQKLDGVDIDTAGNLNEPEGFGHYAKTYGPIVGGAALAAFGIPGVFGGLLSGGGAAGGAASGAAFDAAPSISSLAGAANAASVGTGAAAGAAGAAPMSLWGSIGNFLKGPLGQQAIQSGASLAGGLVNASAANHASDLQSQAADKALQFEQGVYNKDVADFAPYQAAGNASIARLSDLVGQKRDPVTAQGLYDSGRVNGMGLSSMVGAGGGGAVTLRAPDGTTRQFQSNDPKVQLALGRGAVRV